MSCPTFRKVAHCSTPYDKVLRQTNSVVRPSRDKFFVRTLLYDTVGIQCQTVFVGSVNPPLRYSCALCATGGAGAKTWTRSRNGRRRQEYKRAFIFVCTYICLHRYFCVCGTARINRAPSASYLKSAIEQNGRTFKKACRDGDISNGTASKDAGMYVICALRMLMVSCFVVETRSHSQRSKTNETASNAYGTASRGARMYVICILRMLMVSCFVVETRSRSRAVENERDSFERIRYGKQGCPARRHNGRFANVDGEKLFCCRDAFKFTASQNERDSIERIRYGKQGCPHVRYMRFANVDEAVLL